MATIRDRERPDLGGRWGRVRQGQRDGAGPRGSHGEELWGAGVPESWSFVFGRGPVTFRSGDVDGVPCAALQAPSVRVAGSRLSKRRRKPSWMWGLVVGAH